MDWPNGTPTCTTELIAHSSPSPHQGVVLVLRAVAVLSCLHLMFQPCSWNRQSSVCAVGTPLPRTHATPLAVIPWCWRGSSGKHLHPSAKTKLNFPSFFYSRL